MNTNYTVALVGAAILIILALLVFTGRGTPAPATNGGSTTTPPTTTPTSTPTGGTQSPQFTQVKIALLDTTGSGTGKSRGCDTIVMVNKNVPATTAPLGAALRALFEHPEGSQPSTQYNFIARTKSTLKFDRVTITDGTANIYLTGSLSGLAGVCDDPRAQAQLEETALQFASVQKVQIYLNNQPTSLTPSQQ